jgi:hypothetical protein
VNQPAAEVRGGATAEEVAAVLAALDEQARRRPELDRYEQWRARRLEALRR